MPEPDAPVVEPQTYGDAPGWSDRRAVVPEGGRVPIKPRGTQDGNGASSPPDDELPAPSAEPESEPAQEPVEPTTPAPAPEPAAPDVPFNKHPRWIERQQEMEALRRQNQQLLEITNRVTSQPPQVAVPVAPKVDFWAGKIDHPDPAIAQSWQLQKQLYDMSVEEGKARAMQELSPVIQAGMERLAQIDLREFRKENPEITPGSPEEAGIVAYMEGRVDGVRHPLESAKRNALFDKLKTENQTLKNKQALTPQKRVAAAIDRSTGMPATTGLPKRPGDWRQKVEQIVDNGGGWAEIIRNAF